MATSRELRMFLNASFTLLLLGILTSVLVTGQECGLRNTAAAGRSCERACGDGGTCRKENRECVCDGLCGLSCLKKACPLLQSPVEGYVTVTPSQHYIDAVARYRCNRDFTLVGNSNRTCQSDKTWSGSEPVCRELSDSAPVLAETHHCSLLTFPTNGVVAYYEERRIEGTIATYRCDDGYTLIGNKNRTCLREGSWSGSDPDCVVVSCSDVSIQDGNVHNGEVNRISREGDEITFSCNEGFQLRYPQRTTCTSGKWTQALPYCEEVVRCPSVQNPLNGLKIGHDYSYDSEVAFRCNLGYILEGANEIRCLTNGSWSAVPPTCREIRCPAPDVRSNVRSDQSLPEYPYQSTMRFYCEDGYVLRGPNEITCNSNEQWSNIPPICVVACPEEELQHGRVDYRPSRLEHGSERIFTCEEGYHQRQPVAESICNAGVWSTNVPVCTEDPCSEDEIGVGQWRAEYNRVSVERGTRPHGTTATFVCTERGHRTSDTKQCLTGQWRGDAPTCTKIPCAHQNIRNGRVHYSTDNPEQGTARNVSCNVGYQATEMEDSVYDFGSWTTALPECVESKE